MIGKILGNRYEIVEKIGGGGTALVYRATCTLLNREVTIKVLRGEYTSDDDFVSRFRREAQAVAKLSHANIVNIYDVGKEDDIHYLVMEYVEGKNLKEYIKEKAPLPQEEAINIAKQIADALEHAHDHQIVHRDIKPHNILITSTGKVKVTDFGIAKAATNATVTHAGTIIGSVHYFSPEQARGEVTGPKSDIYSLGVVLYEMVTNKVPFEGESPISIALKQIQENPVSPSDINPLVTYNLEKVIKKAMAKNPEARYQKARDMWQDLHNLQIGSPTLAGAEIDTDDFATQVLTKDAIAKELAGKDKSPEVGEEKEEEEDKSKRNKRILWLVVGVVLMGLLLGAGLAGLSNLWSKAEVSVPDFSNLTVEQARINAEANGLQLNVAGEEFHPEIEKGNIISQNPAPEAVVKEGRTVDVIVSKGQEMVQVPKVTRLTLELAEIELNNAELKVGDVVEEFSDGIPAGLIIAQRPDAFTNTPKGSTINLIVSKGPEPRFVPVPDVVGKSLDEARRLIRDAGLQVAEPIIQETSDQYFEGIVIRQEPSPETEGRLVENSQVQLIISRGPGPTARSFEVTLADTDPVRSIVPNDGEQHQVEIRVFDARDPNGRVAHKASYNWENALGRVVTVTIYGKGRIEVYVDGILQMREEV